MKPGSLLLLTSLLFLQGISAAPGSDYLQSGVSSTGPVHLVQASVTDEILTVALLYEDPEGVVTYPFDAVFLMAGQKKYPILRDEKGRFLAAPESKVGTELGRRHGVTLVGGQDRLVWFQFPRPRGQARVQLQIPDAVPFEISLNS